MQGAICPQCHYVYGSRAEVITALEGAGCPKCHCVHVIVVTAVPKEKKPAEFLDKFAPSNN